MTKYGDVIQRYRKISFNDALYLSQFLFTLQVLETYYF